MAFGGGAGIPGGMLTAANLRIPYGNGIGAYDSDNRIRPAAAGSQGIYVGDVGGQRRNQVDTILLFMAQGEFIGQQGVPLSAFTDQTVDGSAVDTGVLVTGVPAANQHGIPVNFGAGRGNWFLPDLARLVVDIIYANPAVFAANQADAAKVSITLLGGNVSIVFKNQGGNGFLTMGIRLHYVHSLEM